MYDVLIVGGGVVGTAVARELSKYQLRTVLLEKNVEIGMGATKANSGIVHAGHDCETETLKAKLNVRGNEMYTELCEDLNVMFRRNGSLVLAFSERELPALEALKARGEANGVPSIEILFKDELLKREPRLSPEVYAALHAPTSGLVFGPELGAALAENACRNGVEIVLATEVLGIEKLADRYVVLTNQAKYETKLVINAAGLYSDVMNNFVSEKKYEITPRKGEYYLLDRRAKDVVEKTVFQLPTEKGKGVLILPTIHDNVLVGPSSEFVTSKEDVSTNADILADIRDLASKSMPDVPLYMTITTFTGLRAKAKDHDDFIIEEVIDGFINAVGIDSPGLTSAPAIGEYICEMVVEKLKPETNNEFVKTREAMPLFNTLPLEKQNELIKLNPAYGRVICRCEQVTEGDIMNTIRAPFGARSLDGIKFKARAGAGRCQGGFCTPDVIEILARELDIVVTKITKRGGESYILAQSEEVAYS